MTILAWRAALGIAGLVACATTANAQTASPIDRGSTIVSGSASWSRSSTDGFPSSTSASFAPSALHFFWPHLAAGGSVSVGYSRGNSSTQWSLGVGPEVRYYAGSLDAKTLPFVAVALRPTWSQSRSDNTALFSEHDLTGDVSAGLTQMIAKGVGLTGAAYFSRLWRYRNGTDTKLITKQYGLRFGVAAFLY
ncbi:MAG TPA: hypothetical protein VGM82_04595 [Gemmatimonadaceae bacterium]|jgi:hypothetical protein